MFSFYNPNCEIVNKDSVFELLDNAPVVDSDNDIIIGIAKPKFMFNGIIMGDIICRQYDFDFVGDMWNYEFICRESGLDFEKNPQLNIKNIQAIYVKMESECRHCITLNKRHQDNNMLFCLGCKHFYGDNSMTNWG